jgi:hypothetical protein
MQLLLIVCLCTVSAVVYGILHDQVTARICVEYFTIGHPRIFDTDDPTLLGFAWGIIATWWVGLILGVALALVARAGTRPMIPVAKLIQPVLVLFGVAAALALISGLVGWHLAESGNVYLVGPLAQRISADRHSLFLAVMWAHWASYIAGLVGGIVIMVRLWRFRGQSLCAGAPRPRSSSSPGLSE